MYPEQSMLPIQDHIKDIEHALANRRCAVIQAPPGAGKTTRVPLALLDAPWLGDKKILLLEPRRLAAISCAGHMAHLCKQPVGQTVGYQIRLDKNVSSATRIEVITEGIFTRKIQQDPYLSDVGLVIFDEFHERNIHSELGLALCMETFEALRDDLRVLVMSATMDVAKISSLLDDAPMIVSKGKTHPVKTIYLEKQRPGGRQVSIENTCVTAIGKALKNSGNDILVFLPGIREIRQTFSLLEKLNLPDVHILPLYGNLSAREQAQVIAPSDSKKRKVVLATSIAETSITIQGVDTVIDSGLMRIPQFSWKTGMSRLATVPVSKACADQRRGRAGRTGPGTCFRLWSAYHQGLLKPYSLPEILSTDLAPFVLELAFWGVSDPSQLKLLDLPPNASLDQARVLLHSLGALDANHKITEHGKKMAGAGLHPRLSHMIIRGKKKNLGALACRLAAFLNERDFIRFDSRAFHTGAFDPDIRLRLEWIARAQQNKINAPKGGKINHGILRHILVSEKKLLSQFDILPSKSDPDQAGRLLAWAYPDQIAKKRETTQNTFLTSSGKGIYFPSPCPVSMSEYIVATGLDGNPKNSKVFLAAPYWIDDLKSDFKKDVKQQVHTVLDKKTGVICTKKETVFKKISIETQVLKDTDIDAADKVLVDHIRTSGLGILPWSKRLNALKDRIQFLTTHTKDSALPDVSDNMLLENLEVWLAPFLTGITSLRQLGKMDLDTAFLSMLSWEQQQEIDKNTPTHIIVPSGSKKPLQYRQGKKILDSPLLDVRLQEMFGLTRTPKIAGGAVCVTIALLSPAGRPVQITQDLESFWASGYAEVKKDLAGRYPKHYWPDNPLTAVPTSRVKPRK